MQDFPVMTMLQSKAYLCEPVQHLVFREVVESSSGLPLLMLFLDSALQITTISIVHHNAKLALLSLVHLSEPNDAWMIKSF